MIAHLFSPRQQP